MENPRMLLAAFIDRRLADDNTPDGRERGQLGAFIARLAKALGEEDELKVRNFAWNVRAGSKSIPKGTEDAWARALRIRDPLDREEFQGLVDAGRLWGKKDGRQTVGKMDATITSLRDQVSTLVLELEASERAVEALREESKAQAALILELKSRLKRQ
jgi:hypothetical protein